MAPAAVNSGAPVARNDVRLGAMLALTGEWRGAELARTGPWHGTKRATGGAWHGGQELAPTEQGLRAKGRDGSEMGCKHCG
jgi:hypothetical protein